MRPKARSADVRRYTTRCRIVLSQLAADSLRSWVRSWWRPWGQRRKGSSKAAKVCGQVRVIVQEVVSPPNKCTSISQSLARGRSLGGCPWSRFCSSFRRESTCRFEARGARQDLKNCDECLQIPSKSIHRAHGIAKACGASRWWWVGGWGVMAWVRKEHRRRKEAVASTTNSLRTTSTTRTATTAAVAPFMSLAAWR